MNRVTHCTGSIVSYPVDQSSQLHVWSADPQLVLEDGQLVSSGEAEMGENAMELAVFQVIDPEWERSDSRE